MFLRATFLGVTAFWLVMNVWLWRTEFGERGSDTAVPLALVWKKILTAPDASSLSVYQHRERMGYCEFSTSVGQQMATLEDDKLPPENLAAAGYQVHLAGNVAFGDFTNRFKFDGKVRFKNAHDWEDLRLRIVSRQVVLEINSAASNQLVHVRISSDGEVLERDLTFVELQNPSALLRVFAGNYAEPLLGFMDLPSLPTANASAQPIWTAQRTRIKIGTEMVPIYRLAANLLGREIAVEVSTLGEVLRIKLPGDFTASIEDLSRP